jgi:4-amino-4-deoxy-L-arabinose transferase-like glycosyltransferase
VIKWLKDHWLMFTILLLAAWFRIGGISDFDFHHDELSALLRTQFSSLDALIANGVAIDGHPAFTQLFLWVYTNVFGFEPWVVKLPFAIASLFCVLLGFSIGKQLFGESAGYVTAMLLSVLQYGIIYAQWARPYSFGLLFVMLAFWGLVSFRTYRLHLYLVVFTVSTALAGLTHYFALVQVIIISFFWWLGQSTSAKKSILMASIFAFLLFLPHWSITMHHLSIGGIGEWLKKPNADFWWQTIQFVFHYHWLVPAFVLAFVLLGIRDVPIKLEHWLARFLLVVASVLPFTIAYYYSVYENPLLHFGTVFFSFPFFILLFSSFVGFPKRILPVLFVLITLFGAAQIWVGRQHKTLNQTTEYMAPFKWAATFQNKPHLLFDLRNDAVSLMAKENGLDTTNLTFAWSQWEANDIAVYYHQIPKEDSVMVVVTPSSNQEYLSAALWRFPNVEEVHGYQSGAAYLLSARTDTADRRNGIDTLTYDSIGGALTAQNPYTKGLKKSLEPSDFRNFWVGATYTSNEIPDGALVVELFDGEKSIGAYQADFSKTYVAGDSVQHAAWFIDGVDLRKYENVNIKTFVWNKGQIPFLAKELYLKTFKGNDLKYKLFER